MGLGYSFSGHMRTLLPFYYETVRFTLVYTTYWHIVTPILAAELPFVFIRVSSIGINAIRANPYLKYLALSYCLMAFLLHANLLWMKEGQRNEK